MSVVIQVENLSKSYRLGAIGGGTLREDVSRWLARLRGRPDPTLKIGQEHHARLMGHEFWALQDVSFEVREGEILGIIGRNGAGKSTLLKILSRVTAPTRGEVRVKGRIASLLEVGTGFHPELSGRENIFLNGAILGMSKAEIRKKFDEIVAFSEVEEFIDTPVKRYSSGMYVRLAFAVAAHLEPEILIVDEVLAVGDAEFQEKCLGKMDEVARGGRTILFVSHNIGAISKLCTRAMLLGQGLKQQDGPVAGVVEHYARLSGSHNGEVLFPEKSSGLDSKNVCLRSVRILSGGKVTGEPLIDQPIVFQITFETLRPGLRISTGLHIVHSVKGDVLSSANFPSASIERDELFGRELPQGVYCATCTLPGLFLNEGDYSLNVVLFHNVTTVEVLERDALHFRVLETGAMRAEWTGMWIGVVRPRLGWQTKAVAP